MSSIPKPMGIQIEFDFAYESITDFLTWNVHRISTQWPLEATSVGHVGHGARVVVIFKLPVQVLQANLLGKNPWFPVKIFPDVPNKTNPMKQISRKNVKPMIHGFIIGENKMEHVFVMFVVFSPGNRLFPFHTHA